jgi:hypothetical protein
MTLFVLPAYYSHFTLLIYHHLPLSSVFSPIDRFALVPCSATQCPSNLFSYHRMSLPVVTCQTLHVLQQILYQRQNYLWKRRKFIVILIQYGADEINAEPYVPCIWIRKQSVLTLNVRLLREIMSARNTIKLTNVCRMTVLIFWLLVYDLWAIL